MLRLNSFHPVSPLHFRGAKRPEKLPKLSFEQSAQLSGLCYSDSYPDRWSILEHRFFVIGNGYEWENGRLVDKYPDSDDLIMNRNRALTKLELARLVVAGDYDPRTELTPDAIPILPKLRPIEDDLFHEYLANLPAEDLARIRQEMMEMLGKLGGVQEREPRDTNPNAAFPISQDSAINNIPDDVQPDYLAAAFEALNLLIENDPAQREEGLRIKRQLESRFRDRLPKQTGG